MTNIKMYSWIVDVWDIQGIEFEVYKDNRIRTYEINKVLLSCFDDKNTYPKQWMSWISSWLLRLIIKKTVILITI